MKPVSVLAFLLIALASPSHAQDAPDIRANVGEVKDTRTTGQFFAGLEIELNVMSDSLNEARAMRFSVSSAKDDQGTDLIKKEDDDFDSNEFEELDSFNLDNGQAKLKVELRNPLRKAMYVKELAGTLELFVPKNDENATVSIKKFSEQTGSPLKSDKLASAKAEVTILTKEQYEKASAEKKEEPSEDVGEALGEAFSEAFSSMFNMMGSVGDNSVILRVNDPEAAILSTEFYDASGEQIDSYGRTTMGDTSVYDFEQPLPADAEVRLFLRTEKSIIKLPLQMKDIALP